MGIRLEKKENGNDYVPSVFAKRFDHVCGAMQTDPDKCVVISFVKHVDGPSLGIIINEPGDKSGYGADKVGEEIARLIYNIGKGHLEKSMIEALANFAKIENSDAFVKALEMFAVLTQKVDNTPFMDPSDTFRINH